MHALYMCLMKTLKEKSLHTCQQPHLEGRVLAYQQGCKQHHVVAFSYTLKGQCDGTKPFKYHYNICKHNKLRNVMNYIMNW